MSQHGHFRGALGGNGSLKVLHGRLHCTHKTKVVNVEFNICNTSATQVGQFRAQSIFSFHVFFPFVPVYAMLIFPLSHFDLFLFPGSSVTCI